MVRLPEVQAKLSGFGLEPASGPIEDFSLRIQSDLAYWKQMVVDHNIKLEQ